MATLLIDMPSGIAGDMLLGALVACGADAGAIAARLGALGAGPVGLRSAAVLRGGLAAVQVVVDAPQEADWLPAISLRPGRPVPAAPARAPGHRTWTAIRALLGRAPLAERVRERAQAVFRLLAEAEAAVHGCAPEDIHFHEVGAVDAIADVVGCCLALEDLGVDRIVAGPLRPGAGTVRCAHGLMPVPVPAVAELLRRTAPRAGRRPPWHAAEGEPGELTTPTGAALVCALADAFCDGPAAPQETLAVGYGAGSRDRPGTANAVRATLVRELPGGDGDETVAELACQVDDMTGEHLGALLDELLGAGALDACIAPVLMKKGRPGHAITVIARPGDRARLGALLLARSTSLGVRHRLCARSVLPREAGLVEVAGHAIPLKVARLPDGTRRAKPEADAVRRAAAALGWTLERVSREALRAWPG